MIEEEEDIPPQQKSATAPAPDHEPVDPDLPKEALTNLQALVRGNGIKPESVTLESFSGEVLQFEAHEVFKIMPAISERHTSGRENGERAGSAQDARQKIQAWIDRITRDRDVIKLTATLLKKRKDSGFATEGQVIPLTKYNKAYVVHEPCGPCDASGNTLCQNCRGQRMILCIKCHGQRDIQCHACNGAQFINTSQGRQQCTLCFGRGRIGCDMCQQTGEVPCPKCRNTGKTPCRNCGASGWHSHTFQLDVKAKGHFVYDADALPPEIPPLIDEYGPRLVTEGHAQVRIVEDIKRLQELEKIAKTDEYMLPYAVRLPWGDIEFGIKGKKLSGKLFGFNPALLEIPTFLEQMMSSALQLVAAAAQGRGDVGAAIAKATRYRTIGDAFIAAARLHPQRATYILQNRYACGFTPEALAKLVTDARLAMKNVAKKPRLAGICIGAALTGLLYGAYFFAGLRVAALTAFATLPDSAPDAALVLLGGAIITGCAQIGAGRALKNALGPLLKRSGEKASKIMPKAGASAMMAFPGALIVFLLVMALAVKTGQHAPQWYYQLLGS